MTFLYSSLELNVVLRAGMGRSHESFEESHSFSLVEWGADVEEPLGCGEGSVFWVRAHGPGAWEGNGKRFFISVM